MSAVARDGGREPTYSVPISCVRPFRGGGAIWVSLTEGGREMPIRPILLLYWDDAVKVRICGAWRLAWRRGRENIVCWCVSSEVKVRSDWSFRGVTSVAWRGLKRRSECESMSMCKTVPASLSDSNDHGSVEPIAHKHLNEYSVSRGALV